MADLPNKQNTGDVTLYDENGNQVAVIQDNSIWRLAVDTNIQSRVSDPVQVSDLGGTGAIKIMYTVPVGKVLYVQTLTSSYASTAGGENALQWRLDGVGFHPQYIADQSGWCHSVFTDGNPIGPIAAGVELTVERVAGASRDWSASFTGYLIDA